MAYILSVDIGTTNVRCYAYSKSAQLLASSTTTIQTIHPYPTWYEFDPNDLWEKTLSVIRKTLQTGNLNPNDCAGLGVTCQRSSFTLWQKSTGKPIINFISWQDLRTVQDCKEFNESWSIYGLRKVSKILGFLTRSDKFIASSIYEFRPEHTSIRLYWVLKNIPQAQKLANEQDLCFGTIDSWIAWKLTKGERHVIDYSNASSTGFFDPFQLCWSGILCKIVGIPISILPQLCSTYENLGQVDQSLFGFSFPITALVADQSASMFAQRCWNVDDIKCTFGTGGFININHGRTPRASLKGYYPLVAWKSLSETVYMCESNIKSIGSTIEWAKSIGLCDNVRELSDMANSVKSKCDCVFVPSLNGYPAPFLKFNTKGAFFGLDLSSTKADMVRAILQGLAFQVRDVLNTAYDENLDNSPLSPFLADGGVTQCEYLMQALSDISSRVIMCSHSEMTALGCAYMCGLGAGFWKNLEEISGFWQLDKLYEPKELSEELKEDYWKWRNAVKVILSDNNS